MVRSVARNDASDSGRKYNHSLRLDGAYYDGAPSANMTTTLRKLENVWETNPATGAAWTRSAVEAMEAGVKLVS
jgi:hypothetical protein